ncbi:hypothetical protein EYE42_15685 [Paracoccus subflavus]|uniref:Uncharacterized protein n=1 Tax=Paracoccus subflavus TaxID=2528244 RepID=A0A4Q9FV56_9RHOB|nr:hypothetical protein [Paracoccus subflavus]TBN36167.1 hypothetical protein EYE42_15685 [Paracoccus subflavus]
MAASLMTALLTLPLAFLAQLFADALKAMPGFRVVSRTQIVPCHGQLIVAVTDPAQNVQSNERKLVMP